MEKKDNSQIINSYIKRMFIEKKKINIQKYENLILYYNIDSSQNKARTIHKTYESRNTSI